MNQKIKQIAIVRVNRTVGASLKRKEVANKEKRENKKTLAKKLASKSEMS